MELSVIAWAGEAPPTEVELEAALVDQQLRVYRWSNEPDDIYSSHTHGYNKILYVVQGSIKFEFPTRHKNLSLIQGDRLEIPSGIRHSATVGPQGVTCLEAHVY